ncbi:YihY/virulence factor BrkB family protein [Paralimibaculum aggregatum]|uniref:YihY/virulence factor BrkB family protein n=1 Tax=Paralimibaculum aggregatum TaxID=3036245 RepID=A0ABQ6LQ11_9RHOB|nr:YihY/virulence factor BrkB family protein [Limibaculum sp. NKW23]GMG84746.1 YihY/virulence factor BrkB family protein [Limibaculum sp. NKW23]
MIGGWARGRFWPFVKAVFWRYNDDQGSVLAGYIAYAAMLSLLPFLVFATALAGFVVGPENSSQALDMIFVGAPEHVKQTLEPVVLDVLSHRRSGVLTASALGSVWMASNGIEALRVGLDHAYDVSRARHIAINRLYAIVLVILGYVVFVVLGLLLVLAPLIFRIFEAFVGIDIPASADLVRFGIGLAILWLTLWVLHRTLPSRPMQDIVLWPGILTSVVLMVLMATGLSVYLAFAPSYTLTYGTLAGVILTLLFFYLAGAATILGAQVNAVVNAGRLGSRAATTAPGVRAPKLSHIRGKSDRRDREG